MSRTLYNMYNKRKKNDVLKHIIIYKEEKQMNSNKIDCYKILLFDLCAMSVCFRYS